MPSSVAAEATAISSTIRTRCFHSRSARRSAQRDSARRATAARRGSSGSRTGRSSRAYVVMLMTTAPAAISGPAGRGGLVDDAAVAQEHDPVRPGGELRVVGDDDRGDAALAVAVDEPHHGLAVRGVERAGRLVGEQQRPLPHHRAGDRDPLPLAAGHLVGEVPGPVAEAELVQGLERGQVRLAHGGAVELERQRHVLRRGEPGQQVEVLEDVADRAAAQLGLGAAGHPQRVLAVDEDGARGRLLQRAGDRQQRGLAGPGRAHDGDHLAGLDGEGDVAQRLHLGGAAAVDLGYGS